MTSQVKNTVVSDSSYIKLPSGTTAQRPGYTVIQWTNTGTPAYNVLAGSTPSGISATNWQAPAGVSSVEVLVVAGGGSGGGTNSSGYESGGGGAGGLIYNTNFAVTPTNNYNVTVGAGGAQVAQNAQGLNGQFSFFGPSGNLATNGSFTSNATGWNSQSSASNTWNSTGGLGTPGCVALTSTGGSNVYNSFTISGFNSGTSYTITWAAKGSANNIANTTFGIGDSIFSNDVIGGTAQSINTTWQIYSYTFTATASTMYFNVYTPNITTYIDEIICVPTQSIMAQGGGGGGSGTFGSIGGSGGGGGFASALRNHGGLPIPGQGNPGGRTATSNFSPDGEQANRGGGGGGAGGAGMHGIDNYLQGTPASGGAGLPVSITGTSTYYAAGGGEHISAGGSGIGGSGTSSAGTAGTASTGSGGGAGGSGSSSGTGGAGGSGVVIIRYYTNAAVTGMLRFNTTLGYSEYYNGTFWLPVSAPVVGVNDGIGGAVGYYGPYKTHNYLTVGNSTFTPMMTGYVEVFLVGGGGGGGFAGCGGGGGGGIVYSNSYFVQAGTNYFVNVGRGGDQPVTNSAGNVGRSGENSTFDTLVAYGGGGGGGADSVNPAYGGGSGGGSTYNQSGGVGIQSQGFAGGSSTASGFASGGGGAGGVGGSTTGSAVTSGPGLYFSITGNTVGYSGGGGAYGNSAGAGGQPSYGGGNYGFAATAGNTGGGGGGNEYNSTNSGFAGSCLGGASGVVVVRYIAQKPAVSQIWTYNTANSSNGQAWKCPTGVNNIELLVVGGGGGGARNNYAGAGGAGGEVVYVPNYPVSPGTWYNVSVGSGGAGTGTANTAGGSGSASQFDQIAASGGTSALNGVASPNGYTFGASTPASGASATDNHANGSGGAGGAGGTLNPINGTCNPGPGYGSSGGPGFLSAISGAPTFYGGGGGGASVSTTGISNNYGGIGGGGRGATAYSAAVTGAANTGGGGGGGNQQANSYASAAGGSGIVIIRYFP
jgi:hypothetical protein